MVELSEDFGNKFDYSFIKIIRNNSEYEFFDKKDNQIFLNHINSIFCLILILERIIFNEPNQEILLDKDEEELLNSHSKEEEYILKSRKKIRLPRKDDSYLILTFSLSNNKSSLIGTWSEDNDFNKEEIELILIKNIKFKFKLLEFNQKNLQIVFDNDI